MDTQPPSEQNREPTNERPEIEVLPDSLQEQHLSLKLEVEQLYGKVDRLRVLLQTLVSGLIIAIAIAIGISGWFAYRLLIQEQIARRDADKATTAEAQMREQITQLVEKLQRQDEQLQRFRQEIPEQLSTLSDTVQTNERQLQLLRDRLQEIGTEKLPQKNSAPPTN